jgi:hypothetical protein
MTATLEELPRRTRGDAAAKGYGPTLSDFDAMRDFLELRVVDPLTFSAIELQWWHENIRELALAAEYDEPTLTLAASPVTKALRLLNKNENAVRISASVSYGRQPGLRLGLMLELFDDLVEKSDEVHRCFELLSNLARAEWEASDPVLASASEELDKLQRLHRTLTSAHLALQDHLEHFVNFAMPMIDTDSLASAEALYAPLFALRDEYFVEPKAGMLRSYLEQTAAVEKTPEFEKLREGNRHNRASIRSKAEVALLDEADLCLPELEAALEVFALMEEKEANSV